jgi:sugar diacid utilization regulator
MLTVADILKRPHFKNAKVIAGQAGINRPVKWVHVFEVTQIGELLNGNELVLSTGIGWKKRREIPVSFLKQLIERNVSGLCIELGTYLSQVPKEMVQLANEADFPLIIFNKEVRFIDITQDIHTLIIDKHYKIISELKNDTQWINDWLNGHHRDEAIRQYLKNIDPLIKPTGSVVCINRLDSNKRKTSYLFNDSETMNLAVVAHSVFEQHGFYPFITTRNNQVIYILVDKRSEKTWKMRMRQAVQQLKSVISYDGLDGCESAVGVGKRTALLSELNKSYKTALEAISIQEKLGRRDSFLYEDLYIYRIISWTAQNSDLNDFIMDYLEPVLAYDKHRQGDLLQTLKVFMECHGSKQETADRLFIARQTLYHRLQKLEELLGNDFMSRDKRIAIEFAILAYEYLNA